VGLTENRPRRRADRGLCRQLPADEDAVCRPSGPGADEADRRGHSRKVLGCHIVAPEAGEMIQLAAIAIGMGATKEDFDRTCRRASDHGGRAGHDAKTDPNRPDDRSLWGLNSARDMTSLGKTERRGSEI
jgi:hypothetical protein